MFLIVDNLKIKLTIVLFRYRSVCSTTKTDETTTIISPSFQLYRQTITKLKGYKLNLKPID